MSRHLLTATFDAATELKDAGAVTASGAATVGGVARVVNLGGGIAQAVLNIDVDAIDVTTGDEGYTILLQGSSSATFASDVHILQRIVVGDSSVTGASVDTPVGRIARLVMNSGDGATPLPYVRIYTTVVGTTPSVNFRAWLTKNPTH